MRPTKANLGAVLRIRTQDPVPFRPTVKKSVSASGINNPDHSLETIFWVKILKFFDADTGSRMEKLGSGIRGKQPGSETLPWGVGWIMTEVF
jgi:hypothetical protein